MCDLDHALPLAVALRAILVQIAGYEAANAARADVACRVFDYIATGGFTQHVSSMCDTVTAQRIDSTKIQKAMQQFLKAEETRLTSLENELASMVGELLGLGATICDSVRFDHVATSTGVTKPRAVLVRVPRTALRRVPAGQRVGGAMAGCQGTEQCSSALARLPLPVAAVSLDVPGCEGGCSPVPWSLCRCSRVSSLIWSPVFAMARE